MRPFLLYPIRYQAYMYIYVAICSFIFYALTILPNLQSGPRATFMQLLCQVRVELDRYLSHCCDMIHIKYDQNYCTNEMKINCSAYCSQIQSFELLKRKFPAFHPPQPQQTFQRPGRVVLGKLCAMQQ